MIYLSRFIVELLSPLNLSLCFLTTSFILLISKRQKLGLLALSVGVFILMCCGYGFEAKEKIQSLENQYLPLTESELDNLELQNIRFVVVLGSGHVSDERLPANSQVGGTSLFRLVEGMRVHKRMKDSLLVLCGGVVYDPTPHAVVVGKVALQLGVPEERLVIKAEPRDTMQEAEVVRQLVGNQKFILVTSALHMPRAIELFREKGMFPIPSTTDFIIKKHKVRPPSGLLPSTRNLDLSKRLIYEWIGQKWATIKSMLKSYQ